MIRWRWESGLLALVLASAGTPGAAQEPDRAGLRYGPHGIAVRRLAATGQEVWYPAACGRRPAARLACAAAAADSGRFPLLVYVVPAGGADTDDTAGAAYFVSHGYVVAWVAAPASAVAARAAVTSWPFVDSSRSVLWRWDDDVAGGAGPWRITVSVPRTGRAFVAAIAASGGVRKVALRLPAAGGRRLAVVIGDALLDAVLRDWGGPPQEFARQLGRLGLNP